MKCFPLSSRILFELFLFFCCDKIPIWNFDIFIYLHHWDQYKILNLWCHVTSCTWVLNQIGQLRAISKIFFMIFCIGRHTWHRCIYLMWLDILCSLVRRFIYFHLYVCTSFRLFCVPVNFLLWIFWFWGICDPVILQSTYEAHIWLPAIMFSTIIFRVALIG